MSRILVVLNDACSAAHCLGYAALAAAALTNPEIEALHPRLRPESFIMPTEEVMTSRRRTSLTEFLNLESEKARIELEHWIARHPVGPLPHWLEMEGETVSAIVAQRARLADLVVLGRPNDRPSGEALSAALFDAHRLLLVLPNPVATEPTQFGRHLALAWKPSDQARSALTAALPWLKSADHVSIIMAGKEPPPADAGSEALAILGQHGVTAAFVPIACQHETVGQRLLHEAQALRADAIAIGAYRHMPIIESVLGGVTSYMLHEADLPIFMMH